MGKDETILTEHIRSVKSTKKILGLNTMTTELPKEELVQIIDEVKEIIADKDKDKDKDKVDKEKEDKKKKRKTRKKSKKKERSKDKKDKDKKHKKSSHLKNIEKTKIMEAMTAKKLLADEKNIAAKVGKPTKKLCLYAFEVAKAAIVATNDMKTS